MEDISRDTIEQAQTGDIQAFERIYRASSGFVYSVALRLIRNPQEAQEITQDVFLKIYHNLEDFQFRSSFKTWAYRITMNTALNACKKMSRHESRRQDFDSVIETTPAADDTAKEIIRHEDDRENKMQVERLLQALNPDQRACVVLREIQGLSYQEIAQALKTNINTVRTRLKRARQAMAVSAGLQPPGGG